MTTKRFALAFALAALVALMVPVAANANFAIHGNYVADTDACAGCHRAHTSVSSITWQDAGANDHSALLVSTATEMYQFCYACHDGSAQGADTNVENGIYEGTLYGVQNGVLNGGGFSTMQKYDTSLGATVTVPVSSVHMYQGASWGAYGGGYYGKSATDATTDGSPGTDPTNGKPRDKGESTAVKMDCATCHDPHGSANYRILKSMVNGNRVGGYDNTNSSVNPDPDGFVSSTERGWPAGGFRLHTAYPSYQPDYTTPRYAKGYDMKQAAAGNLVEDPTKGMSGWCTGCHSTYLQPVRVITRSDGTTYAASATMYDAGDGGNYRLRHRHPMNVELSTYNGPDKSSMVIGALPIPLANSLNESSTVGAPAKTDSDWIECLTCHRAHGTAAAMTGYAATGTLVVDTDGVARNQFPASPSALLRLDNRGVCESCHNK